MPQKQEKNKAGKGGGARKIGRQKKHNSFLQWKHRHTYKGQLPRITDNPGPYKKMRQMIHENDHLKKRGTAHFLITVDALKGEELIPMTAQEREVAELQSKGRVTVLVNDEGKTIGVFA